MRYTEADRESTFVEDRRNQGEESLSSRIYRETSDFFRDLTKSLPSASSAEDALKKLGFGSPEVPKEEIQIPEQKLEIGQGWLDDQLAKSKLPQKDAVQPEIKPEVTPEVKPEEKPINNEEGAAPKKADDVNENRVSPTSEPNAPNEETNISKIEQTSEPQFLDLSSPY
ncbi:MAG: hypothetical protein SGJ27_17215 [Candidatus Melainabacteria bacterium]|nr:hypothetical protein [Candidatus Melainabacteria bacterium]